MSNIDAHLGEEIHHRMWRRNIPQRTVAAELGISQSALSLKIRGRRPFAIEELLIIASMLGGELTDYLPDRATWSQLRTTSPTAGP